MKTVYRLFSIACLSFAGLIGCAADTGTTTDTMGVESAPETTVIRYTAEDIVALKAGESLRLDLTLPNTVYTVTYTDPAILDRFIVIQRDDQYVLRDHTPETGSFQNNRLKQIVLSGNMVVDPGSGASVAQPIDGNEIIGTSQQALEQQQQVCTCPCCIETGGQLHCC